MAVNLTPKRHPSSSFLQTWGWLLTLLLLAGLSRVEALFPEGPCAAARAPSPSSAESRKANFEDIAARAGLTAMNLNGGDQSKRYIIESSGSGIALVDYDADGWLDVFMAN